VLSHLHHVQLAMPRGREDEARGFFVGVLGMTEIEKPPVLAARGGAWFRGGGVEIHLGVEDPFAPARKAHPGLVVDDLDDAARRVATTGQDVAWDTDFPGFRRFYAHDPFGNRLEFLEPLS
jgi:catechol 2,3-dioxygenase-like lactoylglutathione lyase family enzyme